MLHQDYLLRTNGKKLIMSLKINRLTPEECAKEAAIHRQKFLEQGGILKNKEIYSVEFILCYTDKTWETEKYQVKKRIHDLDNKELCKWFMSNKYREDMNLMHLDIFCRGSD